MMKCTKRDGCVVFAFDGLELQGRLYDFRLEVDANKRAKFYFIGAGCDVPIPSVSSHSLLGAPYQDVDRLGYEYGRIPWYANIIHELVHIWYSARDGKMSPNHAMLVGIVDTPIEICDEEEVIVTGFQLYANTLQFPWRSYSALQSDRAFEVFEDAAKFIAEIINHLS